LTALSPTLLAPHDSLTAGLPEAKPGGRSPSGETGEVPSESGLQMSGPNQPDEGPESELPVPVGELLAGRYVVERIFAEGGMGIVCLGRHAQLEQPVAIKFLRQALTGKPAVVERFLNEARALAALRSEHVVRVMDVGQLESGRPFLVMEHLEGIDLDALVARDGPLDVETAVRYALQVCEPLCEAHALGIVHRDIKPENLFLWSGGPAKDIIKVLDFGLAKQFSSPRAMAVTGPQDSIGSPCYMSPEQITTPQAIDARTDIWSLGVVLYRLLTDSLPFDGNSLLEVLSHVLSAEPRSLHDARPEIAADGELQAIVSRCLAKDRDARYATMTELSEALRGYLESRAEMGAHAAPAHPELARTQRRWPWVLLAAVAATGAALYQADRSGRVQLRRVTDGWLTPARLGANPLSMPGVDHYRPSVGVARGVFAAEPTRDQSGALTLRAEPEPDASALLVPAESTSDAPISEAERIRRITAYRAYLRSRGLTPLREVLNPPDSVTIPGAAEEKPETPEPTPKDLPPAYE